MKPLIGVVAVVALASAGCASVRGENYARPVDPSGKVTNAEKTASGLIITGEEKARLSSDYFGVVDVTFENTTNRWITVRGMALGFGKDRANLVSVPAGEPLQSWARAAHQRELIRRHNTSVALGTLFLAGTAAGTAGAATENVPVAAAGASVAAGSMVATLATDLQTHIDVTESPYFEAHLLSVPFSVPPGLFTKRWIVLNTLGGADAPCVYAMLLDYELEGGQRERAWLTFKNSMTDSDWQRESCEKALPRTVNTY